MSRASTLEWRSLSTAWPWRTGRRITAALLLAAVAASGPAGAQSAEPVAYVLKLEGRWSVGGSRPLKLGQALTAEDIAAGIAGAAPTDRITIVSAGRPYQCVERCERTLGGEPADGRARRFADSMMKSAMKIFQDKPDFPSTVSIRGRVGDGVAALVDGRLDLASVLKDCRSERIDLRLQTVAETPVRTIEPLTVPCQQGRPLPVLARGVEPGLYRLDLLQRSADGYVARGVSAWVLVTTAARRADDEAAYADAVALTRGWEPGVDADTTLALQRAFLEHLGTEVRARP